MCYFAISIITIIFFNSRSKIFPKACTMSTVSRAQIGMVKMHWQYCLSFVCLVVKEKGEGWGLKRDGGWAK